MTMRLAFRELRLNENLHAGLRLEERRFHGKALDVEAPCPEVSRHREEVMIGYDGTERPQPYILASGAGLYPAGRLYRPPVIA